ncbi:MAG: DUF2497 domain-containing protein [Rhizobiaceae bacterium]|nr:DUF2497 domain-containing protein [Rhizobiaceae bacterium]
MVDPVEPSAFAGATGRDRVESNLTPEQRVQAAGDELALSLEDFIIDMDEVRDVAPAAIAQRSVEAPAVVAGSDSPAPAASTMPKAATLPEAGRQHVEARIVQSQPASPPRETPEAPSGARAATVASIMITGGRAAGTAPAAPGAAPTETASAPEQADHKSSILSHVAEKQIAASFTELSEALAASRRRSIDQIAEEMLRPMLQEWLDNNLPTMVERLVREEIERVARGAD